MKNKKGFTLIELLAVIVVLAIIALIATPIVMKTIKNAKKGSIERSADIYVKQVETTVATERLNGNILEGEYEITEAGNICENKKADCDGSREIKIEVSGNKPNSGIIEIKDGKVTLVPSINIDGYDVTYDDENKKYEARELYKGILCIKKDGVDLSNLTYGNEFTCELGDNDSKTFYVLEISENNVSLIMNANIDSKGKAVTSESTDKGLAAWSSDGDNHKDEDESVQAVTAKASLKERTVGWTRLIQSQITMPEVEQLTVASGKTFDPTIGNTGLAEWLYINLFSSEAPYGYWTLTPNQKFIHYAWCMSHHANLNYNLVDKTNLMGIRPVIIIPKSQLG